MALEFKKAKLIKDILTNLRLQEGITLQVNINVNFYIEELVRATHLKFSMCM